MDPKYMTVARVNRRIVEDETLSVELILLRDTEPVIGHEDAEYVAIFLAEDPESLWDPA